MKLSEKAFARVSSILTKIQEHPFVSGLIDGSLALEKFGYYLEQDKFYLNKYARSCAIIASKIEDKHFIKSLDWAESTFIAEQELVQRISDNYKNAKRRYDLLLTSGSSRRIETHTGFLESAYNVTQNEMPAKTKLAVELKEALSEVKKISLQIESTKWSDKVKVAETNQREL